MSVIVLNRWADTEGVAAFDVTSGKPFLDSTRPCPALSPFTLGPVQLYDRLISKNMENGWQYAKRYRQHSDNSEYLRWAVAGWSNPRAVRYPMGKGAVPLHSVWAGEELGYIDARRRIYIPLYSQAVRFWKLDAFMHLKELSDKQDIIILDYDAYDHRALGYTWDDVIHDPERKMGHGFVLAMMLHGYL